MLLVASQPILKKFAEFSHNKQDLSKVCIQSLSLASVYFYGAATRSTQEGENDWAKLLLTGKEKPFAIYSTSIKNTFDHLCVENEYGKFFVTRIAIEDFLSLPQRFQGVNTVPRPSRAVRGVFGVTFKEPIPGSPLAPSEPYNAQGLRNKVLLAPGIWQLRLELIEEEVFGEPVYIVRGMPPYLPREQRDKHFANGTDHITNSKKIRNYTKEKQKLAAAGKLG